MKQSFSSLSLIPADFESFFCFNLADEGRENGVTLRLRRHRNEKMKKLKEMWTNKCIKRINPDGNP